MQQKRRIIELKRNYFKLDLNFSYAYSYSWDMFANKQSEFFELHKTQYRQFVARLQSF